MKGTHGESQPPHWTFLVEPGTNSAESVPLDSEPIPDSGPATDRPIVTLTSAFDDLLDLLPPPRRRGMVAWLAARYYDGYRPDRPEIADLVALELGVLNVDEAVVRRQQRERAGPAAVADIMPLLRARHRRTGPTSSP